MDEFLKWIEAHPGLAAWVQGVGVLLAVIVAILVPWLQERTHYQQDRQKEQKEHKERLRRLTLALRVEIDCAIESANLHQTIAENTLAGIEAAKIQGGKISEKEFIGSVAVTDAVIYREVASELGRLPPELIRQTIKFYTFAFDIGRISNMGTSVVQTLDVIRGLTPRLRMAGAILIRLLEKFEQAEFAEDAELKLSPDEGKELAKKVNYPLEEIMKERGLNP